jgi:hypothetical protein
MAGNFGKYGGGGGGGGGGSEPEPPQAPAAAPAPPAEEPKKFGKTATVVLLGLGVAALGSKGKAWLDARKAPEVAVVCKAGANGVDCELEHKVGPKANACFSVEVACASGKPSTGKACSDVDVKGKATVSITDLADWSGCGKASDVKVADLKVTKAP